MRPSLRSVRPAILRLICTGVIAASLAVLTACSKDNPDEIRQRTAEATATMKRDAKAVAEIPIQRVVDSIGLAAAIAEASMPDRVIGTLAASVTSHLRTSAGQLAARLPVPQLDGPTNSLSTVNFEVSRVPPAGDAAMPRSIFIILEEKQAIYGDPRWAGLAQASEVVLRVSIAMGNTGSWTWDSLLADVRGIAEAERALAAQLAGPLGPEYIAAADRAVSLVQALAGKPNPVAGDVWSISAALEGTTRLARQRP